MPAMSGEYNEEYEFCLSGKATRLYQDKKGIPHFPPLRREYGEGQEEEKVFKRFLDLDGGVYTFDDFCREKLGGWRYGYEEADRQLNRIKKEEPYKLKDWKKRYDDLDSKVLQIDKDVKRDDPVLISVFKEVGWREFEWFGSLYPCFRVVWVQKGILEINGWINSIASTINNTGSPRTAHAINLSTQAVGQLVMLTMRESITYNSIF